MIKKIFVWTIGTGVVAVIAGWLVLAAPMFSDFRRTVVQDFLSRQIGQTLLIKTDVKVVVALRSHFTVSDVAIPSETIDGLNLAELTLLEFDLDLISMISGSDTVLDNIRIDGLGVEMRTLSDGLKSWNQSHPSTAQANNEVPAGVHEQNGIIAFLGDKTVDVTSVKLNVENEETGFEFRFVLDAARIEQIPNGGGATLFSRGSVNDQPMEVAGDFPSGAPFTTS
ncbi:MAG: hypothetical protein ABJZ79_14955, partial [Parasphingorhabdus sp.]|uniref:hypothetical protein n=1 Tax=Parasphingorhabdus sp. TaxID=2709688 RepID=UPI003299D4C1